MDYETAQELFDDLSAPFPVEMIEWRVGTTNAKFKKEDEPFKGIPLCYIDARAVMDRLDTICGADGWQCNYTPTPAGTMICNIGVRMPSGDWIWKANGAGGTDMEAEKGAMSDSFKRAAVLWGIGRYLYDLKASKIELDQHKRIPKEALAKLNTLHEDFAQKAGWGLRAGVQAYKVLNRTVELYVRSTADVIDFREQNRGMVDQLPVAMRRHLNEKLDRIGATQQEAAE